MALDPGNLETGWALVREDSSAVGGLQLIDKGIAANKELRSMFVKNKIFDPRRQVLLVETPKPRGQPTAAEEMDTLLAVGRFVQQWAVRGGRWSLVFRGDVKSVVCGDAKAKDAHIRQAMIDRFGGAAVVQKGKKCKKCKGTGRGSLVQPCPACDGVKCITCGGKGWVGRGRPPCPECGGEPCPTCHGALQVTLAQPPSCEVCGGSRYEQEPGALADVTSHVWPALAVACCWVETRQSFSSILGGMKKNRR